MTSERIEKDLQAAEAEIRAASRALADAEARAAEAVADGGTPCDLTRFKQATQKAKASARTLRTALGLAKQREQREAEAAKREAQAQARELFRAQSQTLAKLLDEALEAGRELRDTSAKAARLGAVTMGAGGASPEAENALAAWRDRLRAL
jgi:hypothetical protein